MTSSDAPPLQEIQANGPIWSNGPKVTGGNVIETYEK